MDRHYWEFHFIAPEDRTGIGLRKPCSGGRWNRLSRDIVTSWITLFTARIISRPPDARYSYGYAKADTLATLVLAFIIFFAGAQLAISTVTQLVKGNYTEIPSMLAIYVTSVSILENLS